MKKIFVMFALCFLLVGCEKAETVVIYSSMEKYRNDMLTEMLKKDLPKIEVHIQYFPSGTNMSKIKAEKFETKCDITLDLDFGSLNNISEYLTDFSESDYSLYSEDIIPSEKKYFPSGRSGLSVIINRERLEEKKLEVPTSFLDLLDEKYAGEIIMPNPKASGTGYGFLLGIINLLGEEEGLKYFDVFQKNVKEFSTSGSGPVSKLVLKEASIGFGMTSQAVLEINKGSKIEIIPMKENSPFSAVGFSVIKNKLEKPNVKEVFKYIQTTWNQYDIAHFMPENVYKNQGNTTIENYPNNIIYMDMKGFDSAIIKENLLKKWKY